MDEIWNFLEHMRQDSLVQSILCKNVLWVCWIAARFFLKGNIRYYPCIVVTFYTCVHVFVSKST